jgi:hypothetical protein
MKTNQAALHTVGAARKRCCSRIWLFSSTGNANNKRRVNLHGVAVARGKPANRLVRNLTWVMTLKSYLARQGSHAC